MEHSTVGNERLRGLWNSTRKNELVRGCTIFVFQKYIKCLILTLFSIKQGLISFNCL
jgi:hypothetical protein